VGADIEDGPSGDDKRTLMKALNVCAHGKDFEGMLDLRASFEAGKGLLPDSALPVMASICHQAEHLGVMLQLLQTMEERSMKIKENVYVCLVRCYAVAHDTDAALDIIHTRCGDEGRKLRTYQPVLASYATRGDMAGVFGIIEEIREQGLDISEEVLETVLRGWAVRGAEFRGSTEHREELSSFLLRSREAVFGMELSRVNNVIHAFTLGEYASHGGEVVDTPGVLVEDKRVAKGTVVAENEGNLITVKLVTSNETLAFKPNCVAQMNNDTMVTRRLTYNIRREKHDPPEQASVRLVGVSSESCKCPNCGGRLRRAALTLGERELLGTSLYSAVVEGRIPGRLEPKKEAKILSGKMRRAEDFAAFKSWLSAQKGVEYTHIIDGANVAYNGQNHDSGGFQYTQIQAVVRKLELENPKAKILVLVPAVYTMNIIPNNVQAGANKLRKANKRNIAYLSTADQKILNDLRSRKMLYSVPQASNDDWYWIHMVVTHERKAPAVIITNDKMRDHCFKFMDNRPLWRLQASQVVGFDFGFHPDHMGDVDEMVKRINFLPPPPFSREMQEQEDLDRWHVPVTDDDDLWLCMKPN